jgi:transcriptional regulator with XRE-family HTH domain
MNNIGQKIKKIREIKGFKQDYMADNLEITQQSYSNIESNKIDVSFSKIEQIAKLFGMRLEDLLTFDERVVFNLNAQHTHAVSGIYNSNFPQELKQLYEEQIQLLKEKIAWLEQK